MITDEKIQIIAAGGIRRWAQNKNTDKGVQLKSELACFPLSRHSLPAAGRRGSEQLSDRRNPTKSLAHWANLAVVIIFLSKTKI